jgi:hypothetical protein
VVATHLAPLRASPERRTRGRSSKIHRWIVVMATY